VAPVAALSPGADAARSPAAGPERRAGLAGVAAARIGDDQCGCPQAEPYRRGRRRGRRRLAERTVAATPDGDLDALAWAARWPDRRFPLEDCRHLTRRLELDLLRAGEAVGRERARIMGRLRWHLHELFPGLEIPPRRCDART
jgi:hypothetical protein